MAAITHMAHPVSRENEVLVSALLSSPSDRLRSRTTYLRVRLGVMAEGRVEWLGTHSGAEYAMSAGVHVDLLPRSKAPFRLRKGQTVVVEQFIAGLPATVYGMSVEVTTALTGQTTGDAKHPTGEGGPSGMRRAMAQIEHSGGWERSVLVQLRDDTPQEDV